MAVGKHVGSKIDRSGSTFAARHEAIKAASKIATRVVNGMAQEKEPARASNSVMSGSSAKGSQFGKGFNKT